MTNGACNGKYCLKENRKNIFLYVVFRYLTNITNLHETSMNYYFYCFLTKTRRNIANFFACQRRILSSGTDLC